MSLYFFCTAVHKNDASSNTVLTSQPVASHYSKLSRKHSTASYIASFMPTIKTDCIASYVANSINLST